MTGPSRSRIARAAPEKRIEWLSIRRRSAAARAASIRRQSAEVMAIGFSRNRCLPACSAAIASAACESCAVAMETTSISGSEKTRSGSVVCQAPSCSPATAAAEAGSMSQKPRTATSGSAAAPRACSRPAEPQPISAHPNALESFTTAPPVTD